MTRYYIAVTYEVCEHNDIYEDMNEYLLDSSADLEKQIREIAKLDVAPLIKVYESDTSNFKNYDCTKNINSRNMSVVVMSS